MFGDLSNLLQHFLRFLVMELWIQFLNAEFVNLLEEFLQVIITPVIAINLLIFCFHFEIVGYFHNGLLVDVCDDFHSLLVAQARVAQLRFDLMKIDPIAMLKVGEAPCRDRLSLLLKSCAVGAKL